MHMSFWGELKRRNVVKVGAAYAVVAWLVIQMVSTVLPTFSAPTWIAQSITFILILGFPVALIFAWAFEITPEGIKKTHEVAPGESITHVTGQKLNYLVTALLVVAVAFMAVDNYVLDVAPESSAEPRPAADSLAPAPSAPPAEPPSTPLRNSVAVLPFQNLSDAPENAFFAAGIHEEVLNQLAKLRNLSVTSRTSVLRYENTELSVPEIATALNVGTVLEGSVRYADNRVRISAQLIDAGSDQHLWSEVYERDLADIFAIQADIAMSIANALEAEFTPEEQASIERVPTRSLEAYELYLASRAALRPYNPANIARSLGLVDRALALDADFADAWAFKAQLHLGTLLAQGGVDARAPALKLADAEQAATRALALDADSGLAYRALAQAATYRADWPAAHAGFRRAEALGVTDNYAIFLFEVGKVAEAGAYLLAERARDPLADTVAAFVAAYHDSRGDAAAALAECERGFALFGSSQAEWPSGTVNCRLTRVGMGGGKELDWGPQWSALAGLDAAAALGVIRDRYAALDSPNWGAYLTPALLAASYGDPELALSAFEDVLERNPPQAILMWRPWFAEMRALPRFKEVMVEHGFVAYWRAHGWGEFCRPLGADSFECR
jgi:TolB-like protein